MIGIIGAMQSEVEHLISRIENPKTQVVNRFRFVSGSIYGVDVVVAKAGIGKVNAALCAQAMCLLYHPGAVVNTGIAGAIQDGLHPGDAVVSHTLVEHDMDTTPTGDPIGLLVLGDEQRTDLPADPEISKLLFASSQNIGLHTVMGTVATGDIFIATQEKKNAIKEMFNASCCEMEGGAIAHACYMAGVPFSVIRVLSDAADGSAHVDFPSFAKETSRLSSLIVLDFLKNLPAHLR